jgi:hypothetical protein
LGASLLFRYGAAKSGSTTNDALKETDDDNDTCVFPNINVDQNTEWKLTDAMIDNCDEE